MTNGAAATTACVTVDSEPKKNRATFFGSMLSVVSEPVRLTSSGTESSFSRMPSSLE